MSCGRSRDQATERFDKVTAGNNQNMNEDEKQAALEREVCWFATEVTDLLDEYHQERNVPRKILLAELEYIVGCEREELE